jgi:hypothetical protein
MGIFSSIGTFLQKTIIVPAGNAISNLIKPGSGTATAENVFGTSKIGKIYTSVLGASAVAAGIGVAASIPLSAAAKLIPTTLKGKAAALVLVPTIGLAVLKNPVGAVETATTGVTAAGNFIGNASDLLANPSLGGLKTLVTENPLISGGLVASAVLASGAVPLINTALNTAASRASTEALLESNDIKPTETTTALEKVTPKAPKAKKKAKKKKAKKKKVKKKSKKAKKKAKKKKAKKNKKNIKRKRAKRKYG